MVIFFTGRSPTWQWHKSAKLQSVSVSAKDKLHCGGNTSSLKCFQDLTKSPKSDIGGKRVDVRARYWAFLFDNLQRAVDAIYETCEQDESVVECKVSNCFLHLFILIFGISFNLFLFPK